MMKNLSTAMKALTISLIVFSWTRKRLQTFLTQLVPHSTRSSLNSLLTQLVAHSSIQLGNTFQNDKFVGYKVKRRISK